MPLPSRRQAAAAAAAASAAVLSQAAAAAPAKGGFVLGMNTSTLSGHKLTLPQIIDLLSKHGYRSIEPWIRELDAYKQGGGDLKELARRLKDAGLSVDSAIGFPEWIVDDDARRAKGLDEAKRNMEIVAQIGGTRLAAPPVGATDRADLDLNRAAERYRALCDAGDAFGVVPQVELWGFSRCLNRMGACAMVAIDSGHPKACVLADIYHIHRGGGSMADFRLLDPTAVHVMHMNDYPGGIEREKLTDAMRVFPGDGAAPITEGLRTLRNRGFRITLSLELFNREYWQMPAEQVVKTGMAKMKSLLGRL